MSGGRSVACGIRASSCSTGTISRPAWPLRRSQCARNQPDCMGMRPIPAAPPLTETGQTRPPCCPPGVKDRESDGSQGIPSGAIGRKSRPTVAAMARRALKSPVQFPDLWYPLAADVRHHPGGPIRHLPHRGRRARAQQLEKQQDAADPRRYCSQSGESVFVGQGQCRRVVVTQGKSIGAVHPCRGR